MKDLVIIGAGPAGLSALLYATRAGLSAIVLDNGAPGGKLNLTAEIENYPGIKQKTGPELAYELYEHALSFGGEHVYGDVVDIIDHGDHKEVVCADQSYEAKAVLIASGTKERKIGLPNEEALTGKGISYCAVCDAPFYRDKEVAVIGGGNSAVEEAIYLTNFAQKVHIFIRRDVFRADKISLVKMEKNDKIVVHKLKKPHHIVEADGKVAALGVIDSVTEEVEEVPVSGIFPYLGLDPVSDFAKNIGVLDEYGYVITDETMATRVPMVFAAGDVRQKGLRQVVTATNDGAIAGQKIASLLD